MMLAVELPEFPHAVLWQQAAMPSGPGTSTATDPMQSDGGSLILLRVSHL